MHPKMQLSEKGYLAKKFWTEAVHRVTDGVPQYRSIRLTEKTTHEVTSFVTVQFGLG